MKKTAFILFVAGLLAVPPGWAQPMRASGPPRLTGTPYEMTEATGDGFQAEYYNGSHFNRKMLTRVDKQINIKLYDQSPAPGIEAGYFSVRWTGKIYAPQTGRYRFTFVADDAVRLWVNSQLVIDAWAPHQAMPFAGNVYLTGKQLYDLKIEYSQMMPVEAVARAYWQYEQEPHQLITARYVFSKLPSRAVTVASAAAPPAKVISKPSGQKPKPTGTASPVAARKVVPKKTTPAPAGIKTNPPVKVTPSDNEVAVGNRKETAPPTFEHLEAGKAVTLQNIFFDQGKYELRPESYAELDKLVNTLQKYPQLKITITGHTDNAGDFNLNVQLSRDRAKAVADYLVAKRIAPDRLESKGMGGTDPVAPNTTEKNKVKNRRVTFTVR